MSRRRRLMAFAILAMAMIMSAAVIYDGVADRNAEASLEIEQGGIGRGSCPPGYYKCCGDCLPAEYKCRCNEPMRPEGTP